MPLPGPGDLRTVSPITALAASLEPRPGRIPGHRRRRGYQCGVTEAHDTGGVMLNSSTITANIPASDLRRARDFYADKLGLTPSFEMADMMMIYKTDGGTIFTVYQTDYAGQAGHTIAQWH